MDVDRVAARLRERSPDLVVLQEVQHRQARRLAAALDVQSCHWSFKHWPVRIPAEGAATLGVTAPVSVDAQAVTRRWQFWSWRRRIIQIAHLDGLVVVNVHLTPHRDGDAERARELATVLRLQPAPTVIAGDFNASPSSPLFDPLRAAGYVDAGPGDPTNWSGDRSGPPTRRLDYIWSKLPVLEATVPTDDLASYAALSDHLPVTAVLDVPA